MSKAAFKHPPKREPCSRCGECCCKWCACGCDIDALWKRVNYAFTDRPGDGGGDE
jgi:hypothetical protein